MASDKMAAIPLRVIDVITDRAREWVNLIWWGNIPGDGILIVETEMFIDKFQGLTFNVLESHDGVIYSDEPEYDTCHLESLYNVNLATLTGYKDGKLLSVDEQLIRWRVLDPHRFEGVHYDYRMASDERGEYELKEVIAFKDSVLLQLRVCYAYGFGQMKRIMFGVELNGNGELLRFVPETTMRNVLTHIKNAYKVEEAEKLGSW